MSKVIKKITKPISKGLDKIVPNELKPALPYLAAFAPYLLPGGGIFSGMVGRGLASAGANAVSQLAQEGNEGELNALSLLLAGGQGALAAPGDATRGIKSSSETLRGFKNPGEASFTKLPAGNMPGQGGVNGVRGFTTQYDTSNLGFLDKAKNFSAEGLANLADMVGGARETLGGALDLDPTKANLKMLGEAGAAPFSQATGDLAYAQGVKQEKEFNRNQAREAVEAEMRQRGLDQEYINGIISSMTAYGYTQADIDAILELRGYATGGRVGYAFGGGIMNARSDPNFMSMTEIVENVDGDKIEDSFEGATAGGYKLNDFAIDEQLFNMSGKKMYYLKDGSDDGQTYDEFEVREMLYGDQHASGGVINAYNMGGSVLPQGMEMDYRQGGMIPMGSKERADDVPARVSKNEFVMTADAVRAAGGGSVNKVAQRMYQLMNNLEARA